MEKLGLKITHENTFGSIGICDCCHHYQFNMQHLVFVLDEQEYVQLEFLVNEALIYRNSDKYSSARKYMIEVNSKGLILSLTSLQLEQTLELIEMTNIVLSINQIIQ